MRNAVPRPDPLRHHFDLTTGHLQRRGSASVASVVTAHQELQRVLAATPASSNPARGWFAGVGRGHGQRLVGYSWRLRDISRRDAKQKCVHHRGGRTTPGAMRRRSCSDRPSWASKPGPGGHRRLRGRCKTTVGLRMAHRRQRKPCAPRLRSDLLGVRGAGRRRSRSSPWRTRHR